MFEGTVHKHNTEIGTTINELPRSTKLRELPVSPSYVITTGVTFSRWVSDSMINKTANYFLIITINIDDKKIVLQF